VIACHQQETARLSKQKEAFQEALNNACGEINEAARLCPELFTGDELQSVRRELARLMEIIDSRILARLTERE
jgi:hypothetical protein